MTKINKIDPINCRIDYISYIKINKNNKIHNKTRKKIRKKYSQAE
jgi:hypothetical protein